MVFDLMGRQITFIQEFIPTVWAGVGFARGVSMVMDPMVSQVTGTLESLVTGDTDNWCFPSMGA